MSQKEIIYLVGDFRPDTLERWAKWAEITDREIKCIRYEDIPNDNPIIIMCDHGLNDHPFPD